jgi:DNA-directed RNA polymerase subunit RPC12/RpoP
MIPANTDVTCPVCDEEFHIDRDIQEEAIITCPNCEADLMLEDGDLVEVEEDIFEDEDEELEEDLYDDRKGDKNIKFRP